MSMSTSKQWPVTAHQLSSHNLHWWAAGFDEAIMKFLKRESAAHFALIIFAQFQDLKFAKRVHQISRIASAAFRFHLADDRLLATFFDKEFPCLFHRHALRVHFDADDVTAIAQQCID